MSYDTEYNKAAALCATREYCSFDINEKLFNWGVDGKTSKQIISRLIENNFIDENRYAEFYSRDKFKFNGWGKIKIVWNLRQKKIPETIIQTAIETIDACEYESKLFDLLTEKAKKIKSKTPHEKNAALIRFAQSRGFEINEIVRLIKKNL